MDMSLNQLRSVLTEQEQRRGRAFYEGEPISSQNATMLVRVVEKCIQEMATELDLKNTTIMQVRRSHSFPSAKSALSKQEVKKMWFFLIGCFIVPLIVLSFVSDLFLIF